MLNRILIRVALSIITVSAFGCSYFVFVPCSRMSGNCGFIVEYSTSFCDKDGGQFLIFMLEKGWQVTFLALTCDK